MEGNRTAGPQVNLGSWTPVTSFELTLVSQVAQGLKMKSPKEKKTTTLQNETLPVMTQDQYDVCGLGIHNPQSPSLMCFPAKLPVLLPHTTPPPQPRIRGAGPPTHVHPQLLPHPPASSGSPSPGSSLGFCPFFPP